MFLYPGGKSWRTPLSRSDLGSAELRRSRSHVPSITIQNLEIRFIWRAFTSPILESLGPFETYKFRCMAWPKPFRCSTTVKSGCFDTTSQHHYGSMNLCCFTVKRFLQIVFLSSVLMILSRRILCPIFSTTKAPYLTLPRLHSQVHTSMFRIEQLLIAFSFLVRVWLLESDAFPWGIHNSITNSCTKTQSRRSLNFSSN